MPAPETTPTFKTTLSGAVPILVVALVIAVGLAILQLPDDPTAFYLPVWAGTFLALLVPVATIVIRAQVRYNRIELIDLFARTFDLPPHNDQKGSLISFEFVRGKYYADLPAAARNGDLTMVPRFPFQVLSDWMLLFCAIPFIVFSGFGMFIIFGHLFLFQSGGTVEAWLKPSLLAIGGLPSNLLSEPAKVGAYHTNVLTLAAVAFAGSYFFSIRLFLRAVVAFDLSPVTFLRAFLHMVLSVVLVVVAYRVLPSTEQMAALGQGALAALQGTDSNAWPDYDPTTGVGYGWMLLAFAFGFVPESALTYVLQKAGFSFKDRLSELEKHSKVVPVTLLDGIDHLTAFRLEEAYIFDVQNLAAFNPIMLHIESPYGIYTTIDWVAQAQLCLEFGPERFLALRTLNIRTIFDLQEVVSHGSPEIRDAVADILFQSDKRDGDLRRDLGLKTLSKLHLETGGPGALTADAKRTALQTLVAAITGDLHVKRLRQLWNRISQSLEEDGNFQKAASHESQASLTSHAKAATAAEHLTTVDTVGSKSATGQNGGILSHDQQQSVASSQNLPP
jgi:hypothetical protein